MPSAVSIPRSPAANANASNAPSAVAFSPRDMSGVGSPKSFKIGSFGNKFYPGCSPGSILETMDFKDMKMSCSIESDGLPRDPVKDEFCRNYTCCGLPLHDLHALVEHFEEAHVRVMPDQEQAALPTFSFNTSTHAEPFDVDDMEMELDSPGSLSPSSTPSSESPPSTPTFRHNPRASLDTSAFDNTSIFLPRRLSSFSTHSASSSRAASPSPRFQPYSRFSQDVQRPQGCLPPALLHSPATTPPASPHVRARTLPIQTSSTLTSSSSTPASPREERPPPTNGGGPRTKPFKCPTPNCTKQYKQANGLKYHITHGQCSFLPPDPALEALSDREADERMRPFVCAVPACYPHPTGREKEEMGEGVHVVEGKVEPGVGCGRRYKNMNGLRYHYQHSGAHGAVGLALLQSGAHPIPTTLPHHYRSDRSRERRDQQPPQPQSQHVPPFPHAPMQPSQLHQLA